MEQKRLISNKGRTKKRGKRSMSQRNRRKRELVQRILSSTGLEDNEQHRELIKSVINEKRVPAKSSSLMPELYLEIVKSPLDNAAPDISESILLNESLIKEKIEEPVDVTENCVQSNAAEFCPIKEKIEELVDVTENCVQSNATEFCLIKKEIENPFDVVENCVLGNTAEFCQVEEKIEKPLDITENCVLDDAAEFCPIIKMAVPKRYNINRPQMHYRTKRSLAQRIRRLREKVVSNEAQLINTETVENANGLEDNEQNGDLITAVINEKNVPAKSSNLRPEVVMTPLDNPASNVSENIMLNASFIKEKIEEPFNDTENCVLGDAAELCPIIKMVNSKIITHHNKKRPKKNPPFNKRSLAQQIRRLREKGISYTAKLCVSGTVDRAKGLEDNEQHWELIRSGINEKRVPAKSSSLRPSDLYLDIVKTPLDNAVPNISESELLDASLIKKEIEDPFDVVENCVLDNTAEFCQVKMEFEVEDDFDSCSSSDSVELLTSMNTESVRPHIPIPIIDIDESVSADETSMNTDSLKPHIPRSVIDLDKSISMAKTSMNTESVKPHIPISVIDLDKSVSMAKTSMNTEIVKPHLPITVIDLDESVSMAKTPINAESVRPHISKPIIDLDSSVSMTKIKMRDWKSLKTYEKRQSNFLQETSMNTESVKPHVLRSVIDLDKSVSMVKIKMRDWKSLKTYEKRQRNFLHKTNNSTEENRY